MTHRKRPPNRRPSINRRLTWRTESGEHAFHVTIGVDTTTGHPVEVFYADGPQASRVARGWWITPGIVAGALLWWVLIGALL